MTPGLNDHRRAKLLAVAGVLIPEAEGMPAANAVDPTGERIDRVLELRPELLEHILRALDKIGEDDIGAGLERLNTQDPEAMGAVGICVSGAYYIHPEVHRRLGYPGQRQRPATEEEENDYMNDDLLKPVMDRGPIYRHAPE